MNNLSIYAFFALVSYGIYFLGLKYNKSVYYFVLNNFISPYIRLNNDYFIRNFDTLINPYYKGNLPISNKPIHINRNSKNQFVLLNETVTSSQIQELKAGLLSENIMTSLFNKISPYLHMGNISLAYDDFIFIDMLVNKGSYFPGFHSDIEWSTFCKHHGFQIWILLEEDELISPKGNMFVLESKEVEPHTSLMFKKDGLHFQENSKSNIVFAKSKRHYSNLSQINPSFYYLKSKVGQIFLMNPNVFHCSDPRFEKTTRLSFNIRAIYNPSNKLNICNYNNGYTELLKMKFPFSCQKKECFIKGSNKELRFLLA